jgi:hypothetical protein
VTPDIQFFGESGTWSKPPGADRVDVVLRDAMAGPGGLSAIGDELTAHRFQAAHLPGELRIRVGMGEAGGRDGYALIVTHFADGSYAGTIAASGEAFHASAALSSTGTITREDADRAEEWTVREDGTISPDPHPNARVYVSDGSGAREPVCFACGERKSRHGAEKHAFR